jgi:hypothetical protein
MIAMNSITLANNFTLVNGQTIKNRLFKSAMSEQLGDKNQNPQPGLVTLYGRNLITQVNKFLIFCQNKLLLHLPFHLAEV